MRTQTHQKKSEMDKMKATKMPHVEFKRLVIRMLKGLRERMDNLSKNLNVKKDI